MRRRKDKRILIYSHDSFGLGHLRRCRRIAHGLVGEREDLSVLIISGSPIIGSFEFRSRVDFVRVPGVIKLRNGEYQALALKLDIDQTLGLRESILRHTAAAFDPDLFIVDKEPLGLRGEVRATLELLRGRGTPAVLGLRDVMDEPEVFRHEWARKGAFPVLEEFYDQVWVYGVKSIYDPFRGCDVPAAVRARTVFTGYLASDGCARQPVPGGLPVPDGPFILVTPGGGGDGEVLVDWVVSAYESGRPIPLPALVVFGPFMAPDAKARFLNRIDAHPALTALDFHNRVEALMEAATAVVAMGGYNTFCEILSLDKPALIVPRTRPRQEQLLRARRSQHLGLVSMMDGDGARDAHAMAAALTALPGRPPPSAAGVPGLLGGLDTIGRLTATYLDADPGATAAAVGF